MHLSSRGFLLASILVFVTLALIDATTLSAAPAPTPAPLTMATPAQIVPVLAPLASAVVAGESTTLIGSGFTAGSVILAFVATASGAQDYGPFTPDAWAPTSLSWSVPAALPLGNGFVTLMIVNTDQGFTLSATQSQFLLGSAASNIPSITHVSGIGLSPLDPSIPTANVETITRQGVTITITGTGFNGPLVNLFTAAGNVGPLSPLPGATDTSLEITIPFGAPTGPGSLQVVNSPYVGNVLSNAVSIPIGQALDITTINQTDTRIRVNGAGFSTLSVINFFAQSAAGVQNFGGLDEDGDPRIPLNVVSESELIFNIPAGALPGAAFVKVLNPPFIPFSSTSDNTGSFTLGDMD